MKDILVGIVILTLLAACAQQQVVCSNGLVVSDRALCPEPAATPTEEVPPVAPEPVPTAAPPAVPLDPKIQQLLDLHTKKVTSMSFIYTPIVMTGGAPITKPSHTIAIYGDRAKITVKQPTSVDPTTYANFIYMNLATKKARAFCTDLRTFLCSAQEERTVSYSDFAFIRPEDWLANIPADATLKGSKTYQNRDAVILRYQDRATYVELLIDPFYGIPLAARIYADAAYANVTGGAEYREIAFNLVKEADVTPP
jgi:hypothetical protein